MSKTQKGVPRTAKSTFVAPIVNLGLKILTQYNILHYESIVSQADGNNQCVRDKGVTQEKEGVHETPTE